MIKRAFRENQHQPLCDGSVTLAETSLCWVVTLGEIKEEELIAAFSTKEEAEKYAAKKAREEQKDARFLEIYRD